MKGFITYPKIIYGLQHPITGYVVYVGSTQDLFRRLCTHMNNPSPELKEWFDDLRGKMLSPQIIELDRTVDHGNELEMFWIHTLQTWGFKLKNNLLTLAKSTRVKQSHSRGLRNTNVKVHPDLLNKWKGRVQRGDFGTISELIKVSRSEISRIFNTGIGHPNVIEGMKNYFAKKEEELIQELKKSA